MRVIVDLQLADFEALTKHVLAKPDAGARNNFGTVPKIGLWVCIVVVLVVLLQLGVLSRPTLLVALGGIVVFGAIFWLFFRQALSRSMPGDSGVILGSHTYEFTDDAIRDSSRNAESIVRWHAVRSIDETDDHIFVMVDRNAAFIVPKRDLPSESDQQSLRDLVADRVAGAA